jgi:peroxiredoxin
MYGAVIPKSDYHTVTFRNSKENVSRLASPASLHIVQAATMTEAFPDAYAVARVLEAATTEAGVKLVDLVDQAPVLLVFLRHSGCTFCREAISDIAQTRAAIEADGTRIVLVHLGDRAALDRVIERYGVDDLDRIADPDRTLYQSFGLKRGRFLQLLGPKVVWRAIWSGWIRGHGVAWPAADPAQMPGVFRIDRGLVVNRFRHTSAADRPCYVELCEPREDA